MDDWHKSLLGWCKFDSILNLEFSIKSVTTSLDFIRATIIQGIKVVCFTILSGLFFELVEARFYSFVEATESASQLTNREQTSFELKVNESLRIVENFLHQV